MSRTAIFIAEGFEEIEALTVVDLLRRAEIEIQMVSINGNRTVTGSHGITVQCDTLFEKVDFESLDMIILPGGNPGTKHLDEFAPLKEEIRVFDQQKKYISAICAAPGILGRMGLLKGRKACSYPTTEDQLDGADVQRTETVISDHILTSRGMGTAIAFGLAIIERFQTAEKAESLGHAIVYKQ
ncbi:MAG: DJ-1/PfpI family protein [Butyrivibrio sp.]|jgi:4-methyl-5(b-hydroxyethyl)-thiazole monophosphate biosynthesis|nr:DJ-1/PfpI family protein [Butyrivibrio sp.]